MKVKIIFLIIVLFLELAAYAEPKGKPIQLERFAVSALPADLLPPYLDSIVVDSRGNVFSYAGKQNGKETYVVKFDPNLKYITHFGREGKGPGEFSTHLMTTESRLSIDPGDNVCVYDANPNRILIFDNNGKYKSEKNMMQIPDSKFHYIYDIKIVGQGLFMGYGYRRDYRAPYALLFSLDPAEIKQKYPFTTTAKTELERLSHCHGPIGFIATDTRHLVFSHSDIYKFMIYDATGNLKYTVENLSRSQPWTFTEKEMHYIDTHILSPSIEYSPSFNSTLKQSRSNKREFREWLDDIENNKNRIAGSMIDNETIYIFTVKEDITNLNYFPVDIYNLQGKLIKQTWFDKMPETIRHGFVYCSDRDEDDNPLIVKYRMLSD